MVAFGVSQSFECLSKGWRYFDLVLDRYSTRISIGVLTGSTGTADTEGKDFHRHSAVALSTDNIGVVGEYISDRLGS